MASEPLTLYKLMILYMLSCVDFPLTGSQISQFILEKGYTGYFNVQQALADLLDTGLVLANRIYNISYYTITRSGKDTLDSFCHMVSDEILTEIDEYIGQHRYRFRNENDITADYVEVGDKDFQVICEVRGSKEFVSSLTLHVTTEEMAIAICDNWPEHYEEIYSFLVEKLMIRSRKKH